jgi:hypothetical protein
VAVPLPTGGLVLEVVTVARVVVVGEALVRELELAVVRTVVLLLVREELEARVLEEA